MIHVHDKQRCPAGCSCTKKPVLGQKQSAAKRTALGAGILRIQFFLVN